MKVRKVVTQDGEFRWEVYGFVAGRGSKQIKRRFERKVDADNFITDYRVQKAEDAAKPKSLFTMAERTFQEESENWLTCQGVSFSPGHRKRAKDALEKWIRPEIGKLTLDRISPAVFSRFRVKRLESGLKPASVNRETEIMMAILNYSLEQKRIPYNPAAGFKKLKEVREDMKFWEREEASSFLAFANRKYPLGSDKRWVYVVYLLSINTALRAGEIWGLKVGDMVQDDELLHVQRQFDSVIRDFGPVKGKKSRYVPCNPAVKNELRQLIERDGLRHDQTFFRTETGTPIDHDNYTDRYFEKDVAESGVKRIRFHDLRHTGTTLMIAEGIDLKTVKEICGHKDVSTTMGYVHLLGDSIRNVARTYSVVPNVEKPKLRVV